MYLYGDSNLSGNGVTGSSRNQLEATGDQHKSATADESERLLLHIRRPANHEQPNFVSCRMQAQGGRGGLRLTRQQHAVLGKSSCSTSCTATHGFLQGGLRARLTIVTPRSGVPARRCRAPASAMLVLAFARYAGVGIITPVYLSGRRRSRHGQCSLRCLGSLDAHLNVRPVPHTLAAGECWLNLPATCQWLPA